MGYWLIVLGGALAGGLLVLHGFSKTKQVNDCTLDAYDNLLNNRQQPRGRGPGPGDPPATD